MSYHIGIVVSRFNEEYTEALLQSALKELTKQAVSVVRVPGAYEIPLQVQRLAKSKKFDVVIALGVIWQGQTSHAAEIGRAVTDALMRITLDTGVPIIHQVLGLKTDAEARARCMGKKLNRGIEAAHAAIEMAGVNQSKITFQKGS
ncbi:MAG: 6,7-dimethyl-8-ribityllumazine synthase [Verrucomicrobia bacterium Tous-C9LFEB]|nr:MAG: 6,7-dimethyl-8-ribityllumazine synthase [Verrucomicrobia bacterium Tous-C9LFEB]